jgi:6-phosphogluconolactonase
MRRALLGLLAATVFSGTGVSGDVPASSNYYLYVGTYTGPNSKGIYAFRYDASQLVLEPLGAVGEMARPSFLALSPDRRFLYAVSELGNDGKSEGYVYAFAIESATGKLAFLNRQPSGGGGACHLVVDKSGKFLLVANYGSGSAASFPLKPDGSIGDRIAKIQFDGSGPNSTRQRGPHAHAVVLSPDNRFLFVPDLGTDRVQILRFDSSNGSLARNTPAEVAVKPGAGPRHFTFSPQGRFAYVLCEMGSLVVAFRYDSSTGSLTEIQSASTLPDGFTGENNSAEIVVDPDGRFLYTSSRGHDSIAVFPSIARRANSNAFRSSPPKAARLGTSRSIPSDGISSLPTRIPAGSCSLTGMRKPGNSPLRPRPKMPPRRCACSSTPRPSERSYFF